MFFVYSDDVSAFFTKTSANKSAEFWKLIYELKKYSTIALPFWG
ncbi:hypothetical protein R0011_09413 [Lacticaseibacillus rhamnosus R0011]|nr:hypothetical protein LRH_02252 [Lacticaseibacillus rhamnosus HN001]EHJ22297.1 hypothetical protein R0011_09413 [Lacticaseibacillus rhamnosus R0011]GMB72236.1 hypothetical protein NCCP2648_14900 [Lacticaseibacillus rhamnosus]